MKGAQIIFCPTACGYDPNIEDAGGIGGHNSWQIVQRGHAVANACYFVAVNRVGFEVKPAGEEGIDFYGQSFVTDVNRKV